MNFRDLSQHLEAFGCTIDHFEGESYFASNCINGHTCIIEDLTIYSEVALCHYFYELGVSSPNHLCTQYEAYRNIREKIFDKENS